MLRWALPALLVFYVGCGGSDGPTTLEGLPSVTGYVVTPSSAVSLDSYKLTPIRGFPELQTATTGIKLSEFSTTDWTGKSGAFCESGHMILRLFADASQADTVRCYIGAMASVGAFTNPDQGIYQMTFSPARPGGPGPGPGQQPTPVGPMQKTIKFETVKDGDAVTSFKMWGCSSEGMGRAISQDVYMSVAISDTNANLTSVHKRSFTGPGGGTLFMGHRSTASGEIQSDGNWVSKTVVSKGKMQGGSPGNDGYFKHEGDMTATQYSDRFDVSGFMRGALVNAGGGFNFEESGQFYALIQGLNLQSMEDIAFGDGAAKAAFTFGGTSKPEKTRAWLGDGGTAIPDSEAAGSSYYATVNGTALPALGTVDVSTFTFTGEEVWDCSGTPTTVNVASLGQAFFEKMQACNEKALQNQNGFVNCFNATF